MVNPEEGLLDKVGDSADLVFGDFSKKMRTLPPTTFSAVVIWFGHGRTCSALGRRIDALALAAAMASYCCSRKMDCKF